MKGLKIDIENIFNNHQKYFWTSSPSDLIKVVVVNNEDWYNEINVLDFLGKVGRHFRLGTMISRQSVKSRKTKESLNQRYFLYEKL